MSRTNLQYLSGSSAGAQKYSNNKNQFIKEFDVEYDSSNHGASVLSFAKLLHSNFSDFAVSAEALLGIQKSTKRLVYKVRTGRFLRFLNRSSAILQSLSKKLKASNGLIYHQFKVLIHDLHQQIDSLRMRCLSLLRSRIAVRYQFAGLANNVNTYVCL